MDTIEELIVLLRRDDEGLLRVLVANRAFLAATGTDEEIVGLPVHEALPARVAARLLLHAATSSPNPATYADRLDTASGAVDLEVTLTVPEDASDDVLWVGHDVTDRKRQERALARAREELERSNTDLAAFAAVASHDLQEPLRMVASYVELLSRRYADQLDERAQTYIGYATEGAKRMRGLIDALLDYARLRGAPRQVEEVSLDAVIAQVLDDTASRVAETNGRVTVEPLPTVPGDQGELTRLFQNLLTNALKFQRDGAPRVRISAEFASTEWIVHVDDNGIGIPAEHRERMFEMFGRGQARTEFPGHGVGLAVCRSIVGRHGGRIWLDESPDGGARVAVALPTTPPEEILL